MGSNVSVYLPSLLDDKVREEARKRKAKPAQVIRERLLKSYGK